jgi:hypothetical protein
MGGRDLNPDDLIRESGLKAYRIDRKGELGILKSRGPHEKSSVHFDVSSAGFDDLPGQVADAMTFLRGNESGIRAAVAFPGVEWAQLDFAVDHADVAIDCKYLKPELLALAGGLGLGIELSLYPGATSSGGDAQQGVGPDDRSPSAPNRRSTP